MKKANLPMLTRKQFTEHYAKKMGITYHEAERIVKTLMMPMIKQIADGERIELRGLGAFDSKELPAYEGRHPSTGEKLSVPERRKTTFKMSRVLLKKLNENK